LLVVLASRRDSAARALTARHAAAGVCLMTPDDLSRVGWSHHLGHPDHDTAIVAERSLSSRDVDGVLTRIASVTEDDLPHIVAEDRAYVAAEMTAFLLSWLTSLTCPVLSRPTPGCLSGPPWRPERWAQVAHRLGIPVTSRRREARLSSAPDPYARPGSPCVSVTIVGETHVGAVDPALVDHARALAEAAEVELLEVQFSGHERGATLVQASPWPDISDTATGNAIVGHFAGRRPLPVARPFGRDTRFAAGASRSSEVAPGRDRLGAASGDVAVLLWGILEDGPLAAVRDALIQRGVSVFFVDQREVLHTEIDLTVDSGVSGIVRLSDRACALEAVRAAYIRPYDTRELPDVAEAGRESAAWRHALAIDDVLSSWLDLTPALVVSRPAAMASNHSKPFQAAVIRSFGFAVPDTLITTDAKAAREFWDRHQTVVYKSISGVRSIVSRLNATHSDRLTDVMWCPTQFQQYIAGHDCRVHVVGDEVFACEITAGADDYRYAARQGVDVEIRPCRVPDDVAQRCRALAAALDLPVAGIDLRLAPDGRWYCFEVNPSPGFTYYQAATEQPIAESIANLLAAAR
jgi:RimK-like ATP-grasp domain